MGKLLSINVSQPKEIEFKGRKVKTGIFKEAVSGTQKVRKLNIEGDGQADLIGHGGEMRAVYVYSFDNYSYWANQLERTDFTFGQFGENLTVEGMLDHEVCIGDRFQIGTTLFEVTQPRVPCFKLAIKMEKDGFFNDILKSGRLGFYFRVIEEGEVTAGDEITKMSEGYNQMTVDEINKLLYFNKGDLSATRKALEIKALSPGWQQSFRDRLAKAE